MFIGVAILFINVNGQCAGLTDQCGCNAVTTPRTIEVVHVREPERPQYIPTVERQRPVVLQPTIQKFFVVPEKRRSSRYPSTGSTGCSKCDNKEISKDDYVMMPVAVRRKVVKKKKSSDEDLE